jgi:REP element-mobilizing transposase RayT
LLTFKPSDFTVIAQAFADEVAAQNYTCYACAIMPDHVHILIRKHKHQAEEMIANLQSASHCVLRQQEIRPLGHPVWGGHGWKVFLDTPEDIRRTITYIEDNPTKARLPAQKWEFVKEYDGWPLHPGHHPNSPYAMRLRANERRG